MIEDVIAQPVFGNGIIHIIPLVGVPVLRQLLWAEHKN